FGDGNVSVSVVAGEESLASRLARNAHVGDEVIRRATPDAIRCDTSVAVAVEDAALVVDGDFVEVGEIPVRMTSTLLPDAGPALNGIVRGRIDRRPCDAAVVGRSEEHTSELQSHLN